MKRPGRGFWVVIGLGLSIAVFQLIRGKLDVRTGVAVALYILIGVLVPPFAIGFGVLVLLYLIMTNYTSILDWVNQKLPKANSGSSSSGSGGGGGIAKMSPQ